MFIFERLISLGFFFTAILLACFLVSKVKGRQYKIILFLYLLLLGIFAWGYEPYITADLYRLWQYVEYWIYLPWEDVVYYAIQSMTPCWILFSYITNQLGNENWMQTIACLWCYGNIFYVISSVIERFNVKGKDRGFLLFYVMAIGSLYLQAISGIRTMLGFSIVLFCIYREYFEGKKLLIHLPLYVIAALFHKAVLVLVFLRLIFLALQGKSVSSRIIHMIFACGLLIIGGYVGYDMIMAANESAFNYMSNEEEYSYMWEYLIGGIEIIQVYLVCLYGRKVIKKELDNKYKKALSYIIMTVLFTTGCIGFAPVSYAIFRRYTIFATLLSLPILGMFLYECTTLENKCYSKARWWIKFISVIIILLSFSRGDICGYKFF